ncbi:hypothetical protein K2173_006254 [Erythroxylum novogranatense]|uniref:Reverse transcriptase domain-containing protein n=1 Tax=Erythroxylum novogranatense TaxID=1862640 RepID=A0AAV8TDY6_9ROSI|nr:hypothetical protein K2173_006254 [Erythroxylum novogranatense]
MEDDKSSNSSNILLGRPFLSTARTKIDVHDGTLTMEFDGEVITFNVYDAMKYPDDVNYVFSIDIIEPLIQIAFELDTEDKLMIELYKSLNLDNISKIVKEPSHDELHEEPPKLDLKSLPSREPQRHLNPPMMEEIRSFLGHAGFYRHFIKDFSKITQPLCKLLQKDVPFKLSEECKITFDTL